MYAKNWASMPPVSTYQVVLVVFNCSFDGSWFVIGLCMCINYCVVYAVLQYQYRLWSAY